MSKHGKGPVTKRRKDLVLPFSCSAALKGRSPGKLGRVPNVRTRKLSK